MAESLDTQLALADVYAAALFELAREAGTIDDTRDELDELVKLEKQEPDFAALMASSAIGTERREAALETLFRGRLSDTVLNALLVMNRNERSGLVAALSRRFVVRLDRHANQVVVTATSAFELSKDQKKDVLSTAAEITGKTPLVDFVVAPELLGGLVLQIEDWRFDNSVRRQLRVARTRLDERGERGLEVGVGE